MIPFNNLRPLHATLEQELNEAIARVVRSGWYILGPEVAAFETDFAQFHAIPHAVAVANGTDAIELALRAGGIGSGDEVITVAHTAVPTVCAIERAGATPVLVDIDPHTYTMDPEAVRAALTSRTRALVPVHLYGHPAPLNELLPLARAANLLVVEDCAQAHGARYQGQFVGTFGDLAAFSFYPTKNLGAMGDGGAVLTRSPLFAERLRRLRSYGQTARYHHASPGVNSRLDEVQAAILRVKLPHLAAHNANRRQLADRYHALLNGVHLPQTTAGAAVEHVYHLYVIRHPRRDILRSSLQTYGIETLIHYPVPVHLQPAYAHLGYKLGDLPVTERIAHEILSLPLYVGLSLGEVEQVAAAIRQLCEQSTEVA